MRINILLFPIFVLLFAIPASANDGIWLLVDTKKQELDVKLGDITLVRFKNISIGRNGSGFKRKRGDDITPLGKYKIKWFNRNSRYNLFYGVNYPSRENAKKALKAGLINKWSYDRVIKAHDNDQVPPQNTSLGGMIGIHGLGKGNREIHDSMNWTHGCVALTNDQIRQLDNWVKKDTIVVIK